MGGGSPSSTTTTVDKKYNAGMLKLSQEQQQWGSEMFNMFKYGVDYNPDEKILDPSKQTERTERVQTGMDRVRRRNPNWTRSNGEKQWIYEDTPKYETRNISEQDPNAWTTQGELQGYDPNAQVSEMEYLQNLVEANQGLLAGQTEASAAQTELERQAALTAAELLPEQAAAEKAGYQYTTGLNTARSALLPGQKDLAQQGMKFQTSFLNDASKGVDSGKWMDEAQAGVQHGFKLGNEALRKDISSYGLDPGSGRYASQNRSMKMDEASGVSGARTAAQRAAETEDFRRREVAAQGLRIPTI